MGYGKDVQAALREPAHELRRAIPDVYSAYSLLHTSAMTDGAIPAKVKELIALAVAVATQCDGCIAAHARGAARRGASEAEVAEALGVTILLCGGPATVYGPRALAAFKEYAADRPADHLRDGATEREGAGAAGAAGGTA